MPRTVRRQPFTVSTDSDDYVKSYSFTHVDFKGICDNKNDVTVEATTFADAKNVSLDSNGLLTSRAPFKFWDGEAYIIDEWLFGNYGLRAYRIPVYEDKGEYIKVDNLDNYTGDNLLFYFAINCITHNCGNELGFTVAVDDIGWEYVPRFFLVPIEDKIFIWLAGIGLYALNTKGGTYVYFENAIRYLYLPIHKLVLNGIESDLEEKNVLTETYIRRYQYSPLSSINCEKLTGRNMSVNLQGSMTQNKSSHLYDITVSEYQDKTLIYPYSAIGNNYHIDVVQTPRATVMLRYSAIRNTIEISFDGKYFQSLPKLENILGEPLLTRDGFYAIAFTNTGVAQCRLVAQESEDFTSLESTTMTWEIKPYAEGKTIDTSFIPNGYFETIDQFAYVFNVYSETFDGPVQYLYVKWSNGTQGETSMLEVITTDDENHSPEFKSVEKMHLRYVPAYTGETDELRMVVSIFGPGDNRGSFVWEYYFSADRYKGRTSALIEQHEQYSTGSDIFTTVPMRVQDDKLIIETLLATRNSFYNKFYSIKSTYSTSNGTVSPLSFVEIFSVMSDAHYFKIMPNTKNFITDKYFFIDGHQIDLPINGELLVTDENRTLINGDRLSIQIGDTKRTGYVHKVDTNFEPISGNIRSGDLILFKKNGLPDNLFADLTNQNFFYIEHITADTSNTNWNVINGEIKINDTVRLRAYDGDIVLSASHPANDTGEVITLDAWAYPAAPADWDGETWPFSSLPKPYYPNIHGGLREWTAGDGLPAGSVSYYGYVSITKQVKPLSFDSNGAWYNIDGMLWTSQLSTENIIELDEYVNYGSSTNNHRLAVIVDLTPPDFSKTLNEHYFVYENELQVTSARQDHLGNFQLYLSEYNKQKFSNTITNLHPLSDTVMGVFTEDSLWYINTIVAEDGTVAYTKPILSKTPAGCRYGSDVITALDGQALIFPTPRGITVMAPQDFVATTEKSLSYLSDAIQEKYDNFYHDIVSNSTLIPHEDTEVCLPYIKIKTYKYFILFYKYMDKTILLLDTRNGSWWEWDTPYPIKSITTGSRLHVLMQLDFSPIENSTIVSPTSKTPLMGVSFVLTDREISIVTDKNTPFPELGDTPIANIGYYDDTVDGILDGTSELIYENEFIGYRRLLHYASPVIDWFFTSQKLHFDQINNYKAIKGITINVKGDETFNAKISTKAFRDIYHPEQSSVIEVKINDLRTFIKRLNIMHVVDFQYKLENDAGADVASQLRLNSLGIKYEIKEAIR